MPRDISVGNYKTKSKYNILNLVKMRKRQNYLPPKTYGESLLELEGSLLGASQVFGPEVEATGHETEEYEVEDYWQ